jgi:hypothetical protein
VDDEILRSPALSALRLRRGPSAQTLVNRLQELREQPVGPEVAEEVRTAYRLLALACPPEGTRRPVDDMSVSDLRTAFGGGRRRRGLILIDGKWYAPRDVFSGEAIFGKHRPFAPAGSAYAALWRTLGLAEPEAADCIAVLRELAKKPLKSEDRAVVLATVRALARQLDDLSPRGRAALRKLPLWTGTRWRTARPMFALEEAELAPQVARQVAVWETGFASYSELERLLEALDVTLLRPEDFSPVSLDGRGVVSGEDLRRRFALAVEHLREELFRGDQELHDSLGVKWRDLAAANVVIEPTLELEASANGKRVRVEAGAYLGRDPLTLIVRSPDDAGSAEAGGNAVASLFRGDRQKVSWAWTSMWSRAGDNIAPERIVLAEEEVDDGEGTQRLVDLKGQAQDRQDRRRRTGRRDGEAGGDGTKDVEIKPLKDLAELEPDNGAIVNSGARVGGVIFPSANAGGAQGSGRGDDKAPKTEQHGEKSAQSKPQSVLPPLDAREQLALDAVMDALRLNPPQVADLRKRRGIGADMIDELRQAFEMKMSSSSDFPSEVTLTRSEVDRAQSDPDFFLALVAGLEEAAEELRVRFIFDPLDKAAVRIRGEITLSNLRDVEALEYRFRKAAPAPVTRRSGRRSKS